MRVTKQEYQTLDRTVTIYRELVNAGFIEYRETLTRLLQDLKGVEIIPEQTWQPDGAA